ncbi:MAG: ParB/RepB/Spo0J family partition protein, partial [Paucibacter sp.]|nr:ParB/RepB/Spo0J family partition protein [Roseateles sp.]
MEHTKHMLSVPLSHLVRSNDNVRRHSAGQVEELAALIASQSLLQNLVVTEQPLMRGRKLTMRFAVAAGERRRRAMLLLQQRGRLPKDHEVLCELVPLERALEISIAENSGREPLHPADEFDAFKALIDEGKGIEDVAARFGVSVLTVQRRLKLAAVSPKLLDLYRADDGTINLDQLMALAVSDDHAAQERAWFEAQPWDRAPAALKRVLNADAVAASGNALVRFVGIEAYEAAGGVVRRDLFDDEQSRFLSDPALLQCLVTDKLDGMAAELRAEGWAWVETCVRLDPQAMRQFTPCRHDVRKPTRQERDELAALATRSTELDQQERTLDDAPEWSEDEDEAERIELEQQCITVRRTAIQEARKIWSPDVKAHAGALVTVDREGEAAVMRGLMRDTDRKAVAAAIKVADEAEGQGLEAVEAAAKNHPAACSQSLVKRLAAHRTVALQVMLSRNTPVALVALTHAFVTRVFGEDHRRAASALQIAPQLSAYALDAAADDIKDGRAWRALDAARQDWTARLPEQQGEWFTWLLDMPQAELLDLLALCTALTVNALPGAGAAADADVIAEALQLDMADWWEVSPQSYLNHVPKAQIIQALDESEPGQSHEAAGALKKAARS